GAAQRWLRRRLSAYAGRELGAGALQTGAHGKPALADGAFAFNLSHSGAAAVLAIARGVELGVDLETPGRLRPFVALARRYFRPAEARAVAEAAEVARELLFLRLWTAKEAVLKALGRGLAFGLDRLEFDLSAPPIRLAWIAGDGGDAAGWQVRALPVAAPRLGHLAWYGEARQLQCFEDVMPASSTSPDPYQAQL
ncbi:4'-phosphopantetheinyl transferase family protein, partial [Tahibacter caeni]|uniref:4'-phosphopantetheinyl transferase family protein n=1 Tax=Tahibacter caeni TaxID=1453545 RepID=UPI002147ED6F